MMSRVTLLILFFLVLTSAAGMAYEEKIYLFRPESKYITSDYVVPEYLSSEDLIFFTCIEEDYPLRSSVLCLDTNSFEDLPLLKWESGNEYCYIAGYDLDQMDCRNLELQSAYVKDEETVKITKEVRVNELTKSIDKIIRTQYSDGGWRDALSTAAGIWSLSRYPEIFEEEIDLAAQWLKLYRNDDDKCWPRDYCDTETTAHILAILRLSNFTDNYRIINDGEEWLITRQNYYDEDSVWQVSVGELISGTTLTLVSYGGEVLETNFSMPASGRMVFNFTPEIHSKLIVLSTENVKVNVTNQYDDILFRYQGDNMSYSVPYSCWSKGSAGEECDIRVTEYALLTELEEGRREAGEEYLVSENKRSDIAGAYIGEMANISDAALFLFSTQYDWDNVTRWLRFKQNNNGSWGRGTLKFQVGETSNAVISLLDVALNRTDEPIEDAEAWVTNVENDLSENDTLQLAQAFYVLKNNARPFIKTVPQVVFMNQKELELEVYNPSPFDLDALSFEFSDDLADKMSIETKDQMSSYTYRKLTLSQTKEESETTYGYLSVFNYDDEVARIPIVLVHYASINITPPKEVTIFGTKGTINFAVAKSADTFSCDLKWDNTDISSSLSYSIGAQTSLAVSVVFTKGLTKKDTYTGTFTCTAPETKVSVPFSLEIQRYASFPFTVDPQRIALNTSGYDPQFTIQNNLDQLLEVSVSFKRAETYFSLSDKQVVLYPNEAVNITINNLIPEEFNFTSSNTIEVSTLGQSETIQFRSDVVYYPKAPLNPIILIAIIAFAAIALGTAVFFGIKYREVIIRYLKGEKKEAKGEDKLKRMEKEGVNMAVLNMVRLLRFQNKNDEEIMERLRKEGFSEQEIEDMMKVE